MSVAPKVMKHDGVTTTGYFAGCRCVRALAAAMSAGLPVLGLPRVWPVNDGEPTGPWWEMVFSRATALYADEEMPQ